MWLYAIIGLLVIATGLAIHVFKLYFLISGYNSMSVEKKANVDIAGMAKLMGIVFYFDGALLILTSLINVLGVKFSIIPVIVIIVISVLFMLIFIQRYDGNLFDENHKLRKGALKQFLAPVSISVIVFVLVGVMMVWFMQPLELQVEDQYFEITGMYGNEYAYDKIENIAYLTELPKILIRTNGAAVGAHLRGHFKLEEFGAATLFLNTDYKNYVYFEYEGKKIIFNTEVDTLEKIYDSIVEKMGQ